MTYERAKEFMENEIRCIHKADTCDRQCAKCELVKDEDELLDAFATVLKALDIQIERSVRETPLSLDGSILIRCCPKCGEVYSIKYKYCPKCGQHLGWSKKDER